MRFSVVTYGSEGDTRPIVAVCRGLLDAGHEVRCFAEMSTVGSALAHGVPVEPLAGELKSILPRDMPSQALRGSAVLRTIGRSLSLINGATLCWMQAVAAHLRGADALLYSGLASPMARALAAALQKPAVHLCLQPTSTTSAFPSPALPPLRLPGWLNRLSYVASPDRLMAGLYGRSARAARAELFGQRKFPPLQASHPFLYGFSRHLVPRPEDWPVDGLDAPLICGHWPLPAQDWQASEPLLEFLAAGAPPIYVGFGAVASFIGQHGLREIVTAVAGRRTVFYPGWSHITQAMLPRNFLVVGDTPHAWLFPRTALVIHHGGGGTSHTATRAAVPSVVLPVGADQLFWADRLARAGVAPEYIRGTRLNARTLEGMIEFATRDAVRARAVSLAAAMAEEQGVSCAVTAVENFVRTLDAARAPAGTIMA